MSIYDIELKTIDCEDLTLGDYRGRVLLVVNIASKCGLTPQNEGLEALYRKYADKGLVVLGFPCDQFGHMEPGAEAEIIDFCSLNHGVTFPLFAKVEVNGKETHPLFRHLKAGQKGVLGTGAVKWNYTKFLVNREGTVVRRFAPTDPPENLDGAIASLLA